MGNMKGIATRPQKQKFIKKCPSCGEEILITWDVCKSCGAQLMPEVQLKKKGD